MILETFNTLFLSCLFSRVGIHTVFGCFLYWSCWKSAVSLQYLITDISDFLSTCLFWSLLGQSQNKSTHVLQYQLSRCKHMVGGTKGLVLKKVVWESDGKLTVETIIGTTTAINILILYSGCFSNTSCIFMSSIGH